MPAACSPCAIDHAIERLLATPKTTAFRPCKSVDMAAPCEWERITAEDAFLPRRHGDAENAKPQMEQVRVFSARLRNFMVNNLIRLRLVRGL